MRGANRRGNPNARTTSGLFRSARHDSSRNHGQSRAACHFTRLPAGRIATCWPTVAPRSAGRMTVKRFTRQPALARLTAGASFASVVALAARPTHLGNGVVVLWTQETDKFSLRARALTLLQRNMANAPRPVRGPRPRPPRGDELARRSLPKTVGRKPVALPRAPARARTHEPRQ